MGLLIPDDAKQTAEAIFTCALCEKVAAHLRLFVASKNDESQAQKSCYFLQVSGFIGNIESVVSADELARLQTYMEQKSTGKMREMRLKYAPCFCLQCEKAYCAEHWKTTPVFDDGFYDCIYGVCPEGHRQMLDD